MKTAPGTNPYQLQRQEQFERRKQQKLLNPSSSIPPGFPGWYICTYGPTASRTWYARKHHKLPNTVTIFSPGRMIHIQMPQIAAKGSGLVLIRKLTPDQNHEIEDQFECLYLYGRGKPVFKFPSPQT